MPTALFTLSLAVLGLAKPAHATDWPAPADDTALRTLVMEFGIDGHGGISPVTIAKGHAAACEAGQALSCEANSWKGLPWKEALAPAEAACEGGDPLGCVVAGWILTTHPTEHWMDTSLPEFAKGKALQQRACDLGYPRGCADLGYALWVEDAHDEARALLAQACEAGVFNACRATAWAAEDEEEDEVAAYQAHRAGCQPRVFVDPASCNNVGVDLRYGTGTERDDEAANEAFEAACEAGHASACNRLGQAKAWGRGEQKNAAKAADLYIRSCELGYDWGCANGGKLLVQGLAGSHRIDEGRRLLEADCPDGRPESCQHLGEVAIANARMTGSLDEAWQWMGKACKGGIGEACAWQGSALRVGLKTGTPDPAAGEALLRAACFEQEQDEACYRLARHQSVDGTDHTEALDKACALGREEACGEMSGKAFVPGRGKDRPGASSTNETETLRHTVAMKFADDATSACDRDGDDICAGSMLDPLLGPKPTLVDPASLLPWKPAVEAACEGGSAPACLVRGSMAASGTEGEADMGEAARWWTTGCQASRWEDDSCTRLDKALTDHARSLDKEQRVEAAAALCLHGEGEHCPDAVKGVSKLGDEARAERLAMQGCHEGDAALCATYEKLSGESMRVGGPLPASAGLQSMVGMRGVMVKSEYRSLDEAFDGKGAPEVFAAAMPDVRACYEAALERDASTAGTIVLRVFVDSDGVVGRVAVADSDLGDDQANRCISGSIIKHPALPPGKPEGASVVVPLVFQPD